MKKFLNLALLASMLLSCGLQATKDCDPEHGACLAQHVDKTSNERAKICNEVWVKCHGGVGGAIFRGEMVPPPAQEA